MIRIYTDQTILNQENRSRIFPLFLGLIYKEINDIKNYYTLTTNIKECDVVIVPLDLEVMYIKYPQILNTLINEAKQNFKKIWVYSGGDFGITLTDPEITTFRLGGFNNKYNKKNTIILPCFIEDPYNKYLSNLDYVFYTQKPIVGFVGHANGSYSKYLKELIINLKQNTYRLLGKNKSDEQKFFPSSIVRYKLLKILEKSDKITTQFIFRKKYRAGATNETEKMQSTIEYFNNMYNTAYTLCVRGAGNFSVRLYETLAVGRIPIIINTHCNFPLDTIIDWNKHALILNFSDKEKLSDSLYNFHCNFNEVEFIQFQKNNRFLWENYFNYYNYFVTIHNMYTANKMSF